MLVPLYGIFEGDTLALVLLVQDHQTLHEVAARLLRAASVRVAPRAPLSIYAHGKRLDPELSVAKAGLRPLDLIRVKASD